MTYLIRSFAIGILLALPMTLFAQNWQPITMDWNDTKKTVYDLSGYLDAPAGKDGYIHAKEEYFVKPDGSRFKLYGVNLNPNFLFLPKEHATQVAEDFARFGFTTVRLCSPDWWNGGLFPNPNNTLEWSDEMLDRFDYLTAELKKRGIYYSIVLSCCRVFRKDDGIQDYNTMGFGKATYYFDPKVQERYYEFSRRLLTHKNPYTDTEYRHEPALMWIEMLNENSLFEAWTFGRLVPNEKNTAQNAWKPLTKYYADELCTLWNEWLEKNVVQEKRNEWAKALGSTDGKVPQSSGNDWAKCSDEHYQAEMNFFIELEQTFFEKTKKFLKEELGVKSMITGDADHNDWLSQYPHQIAANMHGDFIDAHGYWDHAAYGPPITLNKHNPMVNDPLDSSFNQFARAPMRGKPFTISESNSFFPHRFAGEHAPILTAYSLFQDWDGILWYAWGAGQRVNVNRPDGLSVSTDPIRFCNVILSSLMFHRGDIKPADKTVVRAMTRTEALDSLRWARPAHRPFYTKGYALSTALQHKVQWQMVEENDPALRQKYPAPASLAKIESDTRQLTWKNVDKKQGIVTINTPVTQGVIGFIGGKSESFGDVDIAVKNEFALVVLTSLDGKPIQEANRLLLVAHSDYTSTGFEWAEEKRTVKQIGTFPVKFLPVTGTLGLNNFNAAKKVTVTPLTGLGAPTDQSFDAVRRGTNWSVSLGKEPSVWYLVEIVR